MVGCGFVRVAKPVECHFVKLGLLCFALSASADEQRYSAASCPQTRIFRRWHGFGAAAICQVVQRALSLLHTKMH